MKTDFDFVIFDVRASVAPTLHLVGEDGFATTDDGSVHFRQQSNS
jgi:hypothetical protein